MGGRLKDKVAHVSGAGSSSPGWGNGKAAAVLFAREGAKVLAADINRDAALETKRIIDREGGGPPTSTIPTLLCSTSIRPNAAIQALTMAETWSAREPRRAGIG